MIAMCCAAVVALTAAGATAAQLEHLGRPCKAKNILAGLIVVDRSDGRERLVLSDTNEDSGAKLIFLDFDRDEAQVVQAPAGSGAWALSEVAGDRLIVGTFYDGMFMVFDLVKMEFVKTIKFPGESYIWNLAIGGDGRIYGGAYGGGKLGALDLDTYAFEDLGAPAPPNMYLRNVSSTPDGRILCNFGMEKPTNLLFDPATKKFEPAPPQLEGVSLGVSWNGYFLAGSAAYQGRELRKVDPPFPTPPAAGGGWSVDTRMTTPEVVFLHQGNTLYRYAVGDKELTRVASVDLRGGRPIAVTRDGRAVGVRGQDYYVIKPGDTTVQLKRNPAESSPRPTLFLRAAPDGKLWGGPHFGQTLFWIDPDTGESVNTSNICDAGGEVYDVAFWRGRVYAVAYAGGDIVRYDPARPWDQWNHRNPRVIADVGDKGYIRPTGGVTLGPDGKLYSGWMAKYGTYGGLVAITNPISGATDYIENPLGEQAVYGVATDGKFVYVGTSLGANGLPNKKGESPKFGMIDLETRNVVFERTFQGVGTVRVLGYDTKSKRVALTAGSAVRLFDTDTRMLVESLPADIPAVGAHSVSAPGNGRLYYGSGSDVIALDFSSGTWTRLAQAPAQVTNVAVGPDGAVYISCGADLYALRM